MHWLAQSLRKVQVEPGVIMETQSFKRNLFLNLYREGEKNVTLVCFFLPREREKEREREREREREKCLTLAAYFLVWRPLAFLTVTLSLLQGIFPTQGSSQGLPHCRQMLYHLSNQGSPFMANRWGKNGNSDRTYFLGL